MGIFILESSEKRDRTIISNCITLNNPAAGKHKINSHWNPENKGYNFNMSHSKKDRNDAYPDYLKMIKL